MVIGIPCKIDLEPMVKPPRARCEERVGMIRDAVPRDRRDINIFEKSAWECECQ
jgi:hypothetical protein